jgi:hypothetical protein
MTWVLTTIVGLVAASAGCGGMTTTSAVPVGAPSDVTIKPGEYDGYRITTACSSPDVAYAILGDDGEPLGPELLAAIKDELVGPALREIDANAGVGVGRACDGVGLGVTLSSWSYVDPVLARLSLLVRLVDLRLQISVRVVPPGNRLLQ